MLTLPLEGYRQICVGRGHAWEECQKAVVRIDGFSATVDDLDPAFPASRVSQAVAHMKAASGPGTELKALLRTVGIVAKPGCSCNAKARQLDAWGPDECEARLEEIVGWLRDEARKRRFLWLDSAGRLLIKRAIRNARRAAACKSTAAS